MNHGCGWLCRRPIPPSHPEQDLGKSSHDQQAHSSGPHGNHATNGNGHQAPQHGKGDTGSQSTQQNGAQHAQQAPDVRPPPYRGIPGYYAHGGYAGVPYAEGDPDQYLYQFNYNRLHPYWRNAYRHDDYDDEWDESP